MHRVTAFEKLAARCWNLLNEGKPFLPIFTVGAFLLYHLPSWGSLAFWPAAAGAALPALLLAALYVRYDFPLFLRNYLWLPLIACLLLFDRPDLGLSFFSLGLYFFFTVFFWGTFYYHLRIGTSWWNFTRFWKLVLKHSDSTSGNAQEQMPKFLLLLAVWEGQYRLLAGGAAVAELPWAVLLPFAAGLWLYSWVLHRYLFDWKPAELPAGVRNPPVPQRAPADKVYVIVIDGMRKERFAEARTPFLDQLRAAGTEYANMETVYPARTVVCFSSMFTGAYPREHGISSNMVWRHGVRTETVFDALRRCGKTGRLLGIAHLIDAFGNDVDGVTAVMPNDTADRNIIERAKRIVAERDPDLLAVQLIGTDQTGHSRGVWYDEYVAKIEEADALIREFYGWLADRGLTERAAFIVCADHGQADGIGGHGHLDEGERYVPFWLHGPMIAAGRKIESKQSLVSLAPTIAYLLGAPYPAHNRGRVLAEALAEAEPAAEAPAGEAAK